MLNKFRQLITIAFIAAVFSNAGTAQASHFRGDTDKAVHTGIGAAIQLHGSLTSSIMGFHNAPEIGLYTALSAGLIKELYDMSHHGKFDVLDVLATSGGALATYSLDKYVRLQLEPRKNGGVVNLTGTF